MTIEQWSGIAVCVFAVAILVLLYRDVKRWDGESELDVPQDEDGVVRRIVWDEDGHREISDAEYRDRYQRD